MDDSEPRRFDCFIQGGLFDFRSCWIVFIHVVRGHPGGLQFANREAVKIFLVSVSFRLAFVQCRRTGRNAVFGQWPNGVVAYLSVLYHRSTVHTWWYHLIPNSFHKHRWSRASVLSTSLLVTAQHSEPYRRMCRIQVLYSFSLVEMEILDSRSGLPL